ncbi:hypothetical protein F5I97DRAFT_1899510 [Phlebopus sp. FC_14]|nr:hypothetical protein F5I97DRAFT_1899510 [Phlebopus sp. FC_14]
MSTRLRTCRNMLVFCICFSRSLLSFFGSSFGTTFTSNRITQVFCKSLQPHGHTRAGRGLACSIIRSEETA